MENSHDTHDVSDFHNIRDVHYTDSTHKVCGAQETPRNTTRDTEALKNALIFEKHSLSERVALGVEHYIASLPKDQQAAARQEIPYLVQFLPVLLKHGKNIPDIRLVNPGVPYGGLTRYDKSIIEEKFPEEYMLPNIICKDTQPPTLSEIYNRMRAGQVTFPLMIKPLKGERAEGILFVDDAKTFRKIRKEYHAPKENNTNKRKPIQIEQYSKKEKEFCLQFYIVNDKSSHGPTIRFGGLSERIIPTVVGNGKDSVETLIDALSIEPRYKEKIKQFLNNNEPDKLASIPQAGKSVTIVRTASIDFGVKYKTISFSDEQNKQLCLLVEKLTQHFPEDFINAGRFDLKADSLDDLFAGIVDIIECNAGGGIPTIVYDENLTIAEKYNLLNTHFSLLKDIAESKKPKGNTIHKLLQFPEYVAIGLESISAKNISLLQKNNPQGNHIKEIYGEIFRLLHATRKEKRKNTTKQCVDSLMSLFSRKKW